MQLISLLLTLLAPATVLAAEPPSMGSAIFQMAWALLLVVGLILAIYGLAKKRMLMGKIGGSAIKIIEMRPLMPKATLALVDVRGKELLLGVSADGIHLLADLSQDTGNKKSDFESLLAGQS